MKNINLTIILQNFGSLDEEIEIIQREKSPNITLQSTNEKNSLNPKKHKLLYQK